MCAHTSTSLIPAPNAVSRSFAVARSPRETSLKIVVVCTTSLMSVSKPDLQSLILFLKHATSNFMPCDFKRTTEMFVSRFWPIGCFKDMVGVAAAFAAARHDLYGGSCLCFGKAYFCFAEFGNLPTCCDVGGHSQNECEVSLGHSHVTSGWLFRCIGIFQEGQNGVGHRQHGRRTKTKSDTVAVTRTGCRGASKGIGRR